MTTIADLKYNLTRDDVRALRSAGAVTFHHTEGQGIIKAILTTYSEKPVWSRPQQLLFPDVRYDGKERERVMHGIESTISNYGDVPTSDRASCFEMVHAAQFDGVWSTAAASLKDGDEVVLRWTASNNAETHRTVGFHVDELRLEARRTVGKTKKQQRLQWLIAVRVGPDNSARMVRPTGA